MTKAISIYAGTSPFFSVHEVIERVVLNFVSIQHNSNKFYIIELQKATAESDYPFRIYTEYGRIGKSPRKEGRYYHNQGLATDEFYHIISSKRSKGYIEIEEADKTTPSPTTFTFSYKSPKTDSDYTNQKFYRPMGRRYQPTKRSQAFSVSTPIGYVSAKQVEKGLKILHQIEEKLTGESDVDVDFEYLSNQFYSIIPISLGNKVDYHKYLINDYSKLNEKKAWLQSMNTDLPSHRTFESF